MLTFLSSLAKSFVFIVVFNLKNSELSRQQQDSARACTDFLYWENDCQKKQPALMAMFMLTDPAFSCHGCSIDNTSFMVVDIHQDVHIQSLCACNYRMQLWA